MKKASKTGDSAKRDDVLKRLLLTKPSKQMTKKERITKAAAEKRPAK